MLDADEIRELHDKAYEHNQTTRLRASDDLIFARVTQWDDNLLGESQLQYRGEFNVIRKAQRQIIGDLNANPVQVDFQPIDETSDDSAEIADGLYRTTTRSNESQESFDNSCQESVDCGIGAWRLYTDYENEEIGDERQTVKRQPLYEANNTVFPDPKARRLDKSDMDYCSILEAYTPDSYKELVKELTGEDIDDVYESFAFPEQSYVFPWRQQDHIVYVCRFYHRVLKEVEVYTYIDMFGQVQIFDSNNIEDVLEELEQTGFVLQETKKVKRYEVTEYIVGHELLNKERVAGTNIPVCFQYGERAIVEGEETYEGIVRLAKDPQRLRNFAMSYLADIVSRSPRRKPIFLAEQVQGFEDMYQDNGADNNYPYLLQNRTAADGSELPLGVAGEMPEQPLPSSLAPMMDLTRQSIDDVAGSGLPDNISDIDLSGKAIKNLQNRFDQQSIIYQDHFKYAMRRDGEIFIGMAKEIYDVPRKAMVTLPDGRRKTVDMMMEVQDIETGKLVKLNDLSNGHFQVYSDIAPSYQSQQEQSREEIIQLLGMLTPDNPTYQILLLEYMQMLDGVQFDNLRQHSRKQLLLQGYLEPETEQEQQMIMQAQQAQAQKQDPNMVLAQAEQQKAQADMVDAQTKAMKNQVDQFNAETNRLKVQIDAQEAGFNISDKMRKTEMEEVKTRSDLRSTAINDALKVQEAEYKQIENMSDDELLRIASNGY